MSKEINPVHPTVRRAVRSSCGRSHGLPRSVSQPTHHYQAARGMAVKPEQESRIPEESSRLDQQGPSPPLGESARPALECQALTRLTKCAMIDP